MIQFNLLPDVKLEYLRAERTRKLVISIASLVTVAAIAILLLLVSVTVLQRKHLSDLNKDIKNESAQIEGQTDLSKILTVQNQLAALTGLHNAKPAASRLTTYLSQVTPTAVNINNMAVDFTLHTMTITGTADTLASVNLYVDTLKFTKYCQTSDKQPTICSATVTDGNSGQNRPLDCSNPTDTDNQDCKPAFSNVVLTNFGLSQDEANYTINLNYDPVIFDINQTISLTVPKQVTTRSEIDRPTDLFKLPIDNPKTTTGAKSNG